MDSSEKQTRNKSTILISRKSLISIYTEQVLAEQKVPTSVYQFCYENNMTEAEFYSFFGSFEGIQLEIWNSFFKEAIELTKKEPLYGTFSDREKTLTFFYAFFEVLTQNRSYVLFALKDHRDDLRNTRQLKSLRLHIKEFAAALIGNNNRQQNPQDLKNSVSIFSEGFWLQTLFLLKYWMDDHSSTFENTEIAIENSVHASFDVFHSSPSDKVLDFGKLSWKKKGA